MRKYVVIIAPRDDIHALSVLKRIESIYKGKVKAVLFDSATYPIASHLDWVTENEDFYPIINISEPLAASIGPDVEAALNNLDKRSKTVIPLNQETSLWIRRFRTPIISSSINVSEFRHYCAAAHNTALIAALNNANCFNPYFLEGMSDLKPLQLNKSKQYGFNFPKTLISCDSDKIKEFVTEMHENQSEVIYKEISTSTIGMPTRLFNLTDIDKLKQREYSPMIFQQRISGGVDLRVAVLHNRLFACEWRRDSLDTSIVDIRMEDDIKMWHTTVPESIKNTIIDFHKSLGLIFGVYDFKIDKAGIPFFLELNPSGQWLDMEIDGGQPISECWARFLAEGEKNVHLTTEKLFEREDMKVIAEGAYSIPTNWKKVTTI